MTITQSHQFDSGAVQHEHQLVLALQPKLQLYADREFRELPTQIQEQIRAIRTLNLPTQSGLEHVDPILAQLAKLRYLLEKILNNESIDDVVKRMSEPIPKPGSILEGLVPGEQVGGDPPFDRAQGKQHAIGDSQSSSGGTLTLGSEETTTSDTRPAIPQPSPTGGTLSLGSSDETPKEKQKISPNPSFPKRGATPNSGTLVLPDDTN